MRAITLLPGIKGSARLDDVPEPKEEEGSVLVRSLALGVCGTDREILAGLYGEAPPGDDRLILGHESLGVVEKAPPGSGLSPGDHVVGIVRHPDPVPCSACAAGEWDMCRNGRYTERGIKGRHGFGAERFRVDPAFAIKVDPGLGVLAVLLEPTSIVAKAWDHIDAIGRRSSSWQPRRILVTGAGAIGMLAALMGIQRRFEVHVLDRNKEGPKPNLVRDLGANPLSEVSEIAQLEPDIIIECTGSTSVVREVIERTGPSGILCLLSVTSSQLMELDLGSLNRMMVLQNRVMFGAVNANRRHYHMAADALARADRHHLSRFITRRVPLARWDEALEHRRGDIKVVIDFTL